MDAARSFFASAAGQQEPAPIRQESGPRRGRYVYSIEGDEAELTYALSDGRMIIDHTYVPPDLREKGIALKLVERAVEDARERGLKVTPLCSYAAAQFRRHREWQDLLA
nr:GNAT family N-acetyltransferase [Nitratireductor basaltis]